MDSLAAFSARIEERLHTASIAERQAILQLVVERIVVHDDHIEVEHVVPLHGPDPGPGWRLPQPDRRLRSDGLGRPEYVVRLNGAVHQWRKEPPRELSVGSGS